MDHSAVGKQRSASRHRARGADLDVLLPGAKTSANRESYTEQASFGLSSQRFGAPGLGGC